MVQFSRKTRDRKTESNLTDIILAPPPPPPPLDPIIREIHRASSLQSAASLITTAIDAERNTASPYLKPYYLVVGEKTRIKSCDHLRFLRDSTDFISRDTSTSLSESVFQKKANGFFFSWITSSLFNNMGCSWAKLWNSPPDVPREIPQSLCREAGGDAEAGKLMKEAYSTGEVIGSGAFSTVHRVTHRSSNGTYAMKCVVRSKLTEEDDLALQDEVAILKEFDHKHIIKLYDFFSELDKYYLVLEEMSGGELFDRIVLKSFYNERDARDLCRFLLEAIRYCHQHHVVHRDLKPENLLLQNDNDDSDIKIADFGFAKRVKRPKSLTTQCGTPGYVAPEILKGLPYDEKADMWSAGVILYILLGGYPPFMEENQKFLFKKIKAGKYEFHAEYWSTVSEDAKKLIASLLTVDPDKRLTAAEALQNVWISGDPTALENKDLGVNLAEFKKFNARRKFKALGRAVIGINRMKRITAFQAAIKEASDD